MTRKEQQEEWLGCDDQGNPGAPGQKFTVMFAGVKEIRPNEYELYVKYACGNNQGRYLQPHEVHERRFRGKSLSDLLVSSSNELKLDKYMNDPRMLQAVRNVVYEAEDRLHAIED